MKVSFYILQKNEVGQTRELPFQTSLDFGTSIMIGSIVFLANLEFIVSNLEIMPNHVKAQCLMHFHNSDELIDQTFHQFP